MKNKKITKEEAKILHQGKCDNERLVIKPLRREEITTFFSKNFYSISVWQCFNCKWESEEMVEKNT